MCSLLRKILPIFKFSKQPGLKLVKTNSLWSNYQKNYFTPNNLREEYLILSISSFLYVILFRKPDHLFYCVVAPPEPIIDISSCRGEGGGGGRERRLKNLHWYFLLVDADRWLMKRVLEHH